MVIKKVEIEKFRALKDIKFELGSNLTAIAGKNGTLKTTILGIIGQPFSLEDETNPMHGEKTIDGYNFRSQFSEKFKLSKEKDIAGEHKWKLYIDEEIYPIDSGLLEIKSIPRDSENIRFWNAKGKGKNTGYVQCPVVYLSLKRLYPLGESKKLDIESYDFTEEERKLLVESYKTIFSEVTDNTEYLVNGIKSTSKSSAAISSSNIDPITISSGQDNIGKLLITLLSFKRLNDKYPDDYKGGILLIDELEAALHSSALKHVLAILMKFSGKYNIQIIFTTHSEDIVIKQLLSAQYNSKCKVLYLKKVDDEIKMFEDNLNVNLIKSDLGNIPLPKNEYKKPRIYTEDDVGKEIAKNLIPNHIKSKYDFVTLSIGHGNYYNLLNAKCKEFLNSMIILDGDQYNNKNMKKYKNVIVLPGKVLPEKFMYDFLKDLPAQDKFWNNSIGGYDQEKCFDNYSNASSKDEYKNWYNTQKEDYKLSVSKIIKRWKVYNEDEYNKFIDEFIKSEEYINKD